LQHLHVFGLILTTAPLWCAWSWVVLVVDHVIFLAVAIAVEVEVFELLGGFGGGRLVVLEKVYKGS
jgi:hypothetical protein